MAIYSARKCRRSPQQSIHISILWYWFVTSKYCRCKQFSILPPTFSNVNNPRSENRVLPTCFRGQSSVFVHGLYLFMVYRRCYEYTYKVRSAVVKLVVIVLYTVWTLTQFINKSDYLLSYEEHLLKTIPCRRLLQYSTFYSDF